jgi:hypothetical protein
VPITWEESDPKYINNQQEVCPAAAAVAMAVCVRGGLCPSSHPASYGGRGTRPRPPPLPCISRQEGLAPARPHAQRLELLQGNWLGLAAARAASHAYAHARVSICVCVRMFVYEWWGQSIGGVVGSINWLCPSSHPVSCGGWWGQSIGGVNHRSVIGPWPAPYV